jgi:hypothetical protein
LFNVVENVVTSFFCQVKESPSPFLAAGAVCVRKKGLSRGFEVERTEHSDE